MTIMVISHHKCKCLVEIFNSPSVYAMLYGVDIPNICHRHHRHDGSKSNRGLRTQTTFFITLSQFPQEKLFLRLTRAENFFIGHYNAGHIIARTVKPGTEGGNTNLSSSAGKD